MKIIRTAWGKVSRKASQSKAVAQRETFEFERRGHMTWSAAGSLTQKITFLQVFVRATVAPAQWDCGEETACRKCRSLH